jgi:hypothetical protein
MCLAVLRLITSSNFFGCSLGGDQFGHIRLVLPEQLLAGQEIPRFLAAVVEKQTKTLRHE